MENTRSISWKRIFYSMVPIVLILLLLISSFAWFRNRKQLVTLTKVNAPVSLNLGAGNREDIAFLDMENIDVEAKDNDGNPITEKSFVFCVTGENVVRYRVQLAHTWNIPFTYTIYQANEIQSAEGAAVEYFSSLEKKSYYYQKGEAVAGSYIASDGHNHELTYGDYSQVQNNAEPKYWLSQVQNFDTTGELRVDYYILTISWGGTGIVNNKETDMVYLIAEAE